ncbi:hypothetical protein N7456_008197 [Penicillium angulare]|uniref:ribonuclease H n=1 Tax=Penicillium angulare TaxID=116970 RepID=A0A9W9FC27_9EURO|nr:hypothetical protein N7456_008197 [Penicillium angulare]
MYNNRTASSNYSPRPQLGIGRVIPQRFIPPHPNETPESLFPPQINRSSVPNSMRFIHRNFPHTFLVFTDGISIDNVNAGCAFVFMPQYHNADPPGHIRFRLENEGPTGEEHSPTSCRAELRAALEAIRFCPWTGEGFDRMVIATASAYVFQGITNGARNWRHNGWRTSTRRPVQNRDLWQYLLGEIERWHDTGMTIEFWHISRELNAHANYHARLAAVI